MLLSIISNVVTRWKKANNESVWAIGSERKDYVEVVWDMYKTSYQKIGMHVSSPTGLLDYDKWEIMFDGDKPVAFNLYKSTSMGLKAGLAGTDGSSVGKSMLKEHFKARLMRPGVYAEVSHAVERISAGAPVVCAVHVPKVLGKTVIPQEDGVHYQRSLEGLGPVVKKLIGSPKGVPSGSENACEIYPNPGKPLAPEEAVRLAAEHKVSQEIDMAEHASCQLDLDD